MSVGELVKKHREKKKISQHKLGLKLGFTGGQFISNLERSTTPVPANLIGPISELLGINRRTLVSEALKDYKKAFERSLQRFKEKL
jgi:transcriptional regulator with XRE-family HTH domain